MDGIDVSRGYAVSWASAAVSDPEICLPSRQRLSVRVAVKLTRADSALLAPVSACQEEGTVPAQLSAPVSRCCRPSLLA